MNLPGLNFDLGEDLDMLRDAVRTFAPVSYTHLDVYKRQAWACRPRSTPT